MKKILVLGILVSALSLTTAKAQSVLSSKEKAKIENKFELEKEKKLREYELKLEKKQAAKEAKAKYKAAQKTIKAEYKAQMNKELKAVKEKYNNALKQELKRAKEAYSKGLKYDFKNLERLKNQKVEDFKSSIAEEADKIEERRRGEEVEEAN